MVTTVTRGTTSVAAAGDVLGRAGGQDGAPQRLRRPARGAPRRLGGYYNYYNYYNYKYNHSNNIVCYHY